MSEGDVVTPMRAASNYEYNQKGKIPTEITIDNSVSLSVRKMNVTQIVEFLNTNGKYHSLSKKIKESNEVMKYSPLRLHLIEATKTPLTDKNTKKRTESGLEFLKKNQNEREKFLRLVIKLQQDIGLSVICIPYLDLPYSEYSKFSLTIAKELRKQNQEPLLIFDLDYMNSAEKFSQALSYFINQAGITLFACRHKSFVRNAISYDTISRYCEKEIAFISYDVPRTEISRLQLSTMHSLPFIGNDIYAIESPIFIPKEDGDKSIQRQNILNSKESLKFFNPSNLNIEPSNIRIQHASKILQEMDQSNNQRLDEILNGYDIIENDVQKLGVFRALTKVHELNSSSKEFKNVQRFIDSNESREYVKSKETLDSYFSSIKEKQSK
jgi:hypothetical protein